MIHAPMAGAPRPASAMEVKLQEFADEGGGGGLTPRCPLSSRHVEWKQDRARLFCQHPPKLAAENHLPAFDRGRADQLQRPRNWIAVDRSSTQHLKISQGTKLTDSEMLRSTITGDAFPPMEYTISPDRRNRNLNAINCWVSPNDEKSHADLRSLGGDDVERSTRIAHVRRFAGTPAMLHMGPRVTTRGKGTSDIIPQGQCRAVSFEAANSRHAMNGGCVRKAKRPDSTS